MELFGQIIKRMSPELVDVSQKLSTEIVEAIGTGSVRELNRLRNLQCTKLPTQRRNTRVLVESEHSAAEIFHHDSPYISRHLSNLENSHIRYSVSGLDKFIFSNPTIVEDQECLGLVRRLGVQQSWEIKPILNTGPVVEARNRDGLIGNTINKLPTDIQPTRIKLCWPRDILHFDSPARLNLRSVAKSDSTGLMQLLKNNEDTIDVTSITVCYQPSLAGTTTIENACGLFAKGSVPTKANQIVGLQIDSEGCLARYWLRPPRPPKRGPAIFPRLLD